MGKIFVVTSGEYDDYTIIGVTTDRAVAERLVELHDDGWDSLNIEEWGNMKMQDIENEKPAWYVTIYDNGDIETYKESVPYKAENFNETVFKYYDSFVLRSSWQYKRRSYKEAKKRSKEHDSNN